MDYMQAIFSWVNAPLFATMLLGMFVKWITPKGAFWGLIAGMGSSFTLFLAAKFNWISASLITLSPVSSDMAVNFWRAWWAWCICFIVTIVISLFTEKKPESELVGLVKGFTPDVATGTIPFYKKPEFIGCISLAIFILLNVYFW
jgi:SSS family solute:Na+ symporter